MTSAQKNKALAILNALGNLQTRAEKLAEDLWKRDNLTDEEKTLAETLSDLANFDLADPMNNALGF